MPYVEVSSVHDVIELVNDLESMRRYHAVVVVTPRSDGTYPYDADVISACAHDVRVKVYRFEAADLTYELTHRLGQQLSAFDGAARVYPRGIAWKEDKVLAPLWFADDDPEKLARRQNLLIVKARKFSKQPNQVGKRSLTPPLKRIEPGITPLVLANRQVANTDAERLAVLQLVARDETIRGRDATITELQAKLIEESSRVTRISELYIDAQERQRQAGARTTKGMTRERELLIENADLKRRLSEEREVRRAQVKGAKARITVATSEGPLFQPELFTDLDTAARFAIQSSWVQWVPPTEKSTHPLADYSLGAEFAVSLDDLGVSLQSKALRAIVSVLTGLAVEKRQVHPLRVNSATPAVTRADGATCYRAYIEENVPSARRLHYWKLLDGTIELSRIVVHDDFQP